LRVGDEVEVINTFYFTCGERGTVIGIRGSLVTVDFTMRTSTYYIDELRIGDKRIRWQEVGF
jgi:hypothetical protein